MEVYVSPIYEDVVGRGEWAPLLELHVVSTAAADLGHLDGTDEPSAALSGSEIHNSDTSWPFSVHHRRHLRWRHKLVQGDAVAPDEDALDALAQQLEPLVSRVDKGHEIEWDGNNYVGHLSDDAQAASDEIQDLLEEACWFKEELSCWDTGMWLGSLLDDVTAETSDLEIADLAKEYEADADYQGIILSHSVEEVLRDQRDGLRIDT